MYYPKSEILKVDYTSGTEFLVKSTSAFYKGFYYKTNDGRFFSGKEYNSETKELVPISNSVAGINQKKSYEFHYALPTSQDYDKGFFTRYVIKRVNSGFETILEVDEKEYDRATKDPLYIASKFTWKITGPLYNTPEGIPGVVDQNQKTLDQVEKTIAEVKKYFTNLAQYAK